MSVTIRDVAVRAGVSAATVSRVLNYANKAPRDTVQKVKIAVKELGYTPRQYTKKRLAGTTTGNICLLCSGFHRILQNDFYNQIIDGIEKTVTDAGYNLMLKTISGKQSDRNIIASLVNDPDSKGVFVLGYEVDTQLILGIKESDLPLVLVDNDLWEHNINCVGNDNIAGARHIVKYLVDLGHKRIAFVGGPLYHVSLSERYIGYRQILNQAEIPIDPNLITFCEPRFDDQDGYNAFMKILQQNQNDLPTAVFAANDGLGIGVLRAIREFGLSAPDQISVSGFDDIEAARHVSPSLTTVRVFKKEIGLEAARRMIALINGEINVPAKLAISTKIVVRESTKEHA